MRRCPWPEKQTFYDRRDAWKALTVMEQRRGCYLGLAAYRCTIGHWHLGTVRKIGRRGHIKR